MSAILDLYDVYEFETYMNGFFNLEYPNFDPKHGVRITPFGVGKIFIILV